MRHPILMSVFAALIGLGGAAISVPVSAQGNAAVTIAMVPSLLDDLSKSERKIVDDEFPMLVKDFTGLNGTLVKATSAKDVADRLVAGTAQFGVFQGIEFAEAQAAAPSLKPLLLAEYRHPTNTAVLVVKKDGDIKTFADLKGKDVQFLKQGKEHVHRYMQKEAGGDPAKFFAKMTGSSNHEAILDSVASDRFQGAIVDRNAVELYKEAKGAVFNRNLMVAAESQPFPTSVIAYDPKKANEAVVKQFENGLLKANKSEKGREFMNTFRITAFTPVPADFDKALTAIRTAYPSK